MPCFQTLGRVSPKHKLAYFFHAWGADFGDGRVGGGAPTAPSSISSRRPGRRQLVDLDRMPLNTKLAARDSTVSEKLRLVLLGVVSSGASIGARH